MSRAPDLEFFLPRLRANGNGLVLCAVTDDGRVVTFAMLHLRLRRRVT